VPYQIPKTCIEVFRNAGQLVIPITDPSDQSISLDNRGKRPRKGMSFRRVEADHEYPYDWYCNAAWVIRHNVVIDVDPRNDGIASMQRLQDDTNIKLRSASGGVGARSGGKDSGAHFYFTLPEGFRIGSQKVLHEQYPGIDVKSGNGYVVIPGSKHYSGNMYTWLDDEVTIADGLQMCPQPLLDLIEKKEPEFSAIEGGLSAASSASADQERARVLATQYEGAGSGERNELMYRLACRLLDFGLDSASAHEHLAVADSKNHPPLGQREIHDLYKKAFEYRKNEFGALSVQSEFDEVDTTINFAGQTLTPDEARTQLSELTGRDEAIELAETLRDAHAAEKWDVVAELREKALNAVATSDAGAHAACRSILCGRGGLLSTSQYDKEIASRNASTSDDLPEAIGMMILDRVYGEGRKLRFSNGAFHCFNPNMWHHIAEPEIQNHVLDECKRLRGENPEFTVSHNAVMQATTNILRARTHIRPENFFAHVDRTPPRLLNCTNGELWVDDTGGIELREPEPSNRMFHSLNVAYHPDADCPTYKRVLLEVFQLCDEPKEVARHHLEMKGYMLSPKKPLPVIEVCIGSGANGKSILNGGLMASIAGQAVGLGPLSMFKMDNPHTTSKLMDRLVWVEPDLDHTRAIPSGLLKAFSENTMITVEPKYMAPLNIMSMLSWTLLSNELPRSNDASRGLLRRMFCFPYDFDFEAAGLDDLGLLDKLIEEKEGVFRLWVEGLSRMLARGGHFDVPAECVALRDQWMSAQNILGAFVTECCTMSPGAETYVRELYAAFRKYVTRDGTPSDQVITQNHFTRKLGSMGGLKVVRGTGHQNKVLGLRLDAWEAVMGADEAARTPHVDWLE
jgi:P4 family phage/plasmid primase-like protien